jgi:tRNA-dihydrouridine synthase B
MSIAEKTSIGSPPPPLRLGPLVVDPPVLQAPMAGFTNYAFRQIVRGFGGVGLQATEMVSARGFVCLEERSGEYPDRLWGVREEARPLAVQIWDNDPEVLAQVGAKLAHEFQVSLVDINFGCPVPVITQSAKSGSYLLRYPDRVGAIVARVAQACYPTPVTAKIRLGCTRDTINAIDVAQAVEGANGVGITVHGRTAQDMFRGEANWDEIARIKAHLRRIPLVGNGDLQTPQAVVEVFRRYPVDGVMIGRAALVKPWLFRQIQMALCGGEIPPDPTLAEQRALLLGHHRLIMERFGPRKGTVLMRRYACCYARGLPGARAFRAQVAMVGDAATFRAVVEAHFPSNDASHDPISTEIA